MIFDDDSEDLKLVRLGIDAESFLNSPLGIHLATKAQDEIEEATQALIRAKPSDIESNTALRNRIYVANQAMTWIVQAAAEGRAAHDRIREQEAQDY
jgi:hypothetical protein